MTFAELDLTQPLNLNDLPTGIYSGTVPANVEFPAAGSGGFLFAEPTNVNIEISTARNVEDTIVVVHAHNHRTLLTTSQGFVQRVDDTWYRNPQVDHSMILPPSPETVQARLATAELPVVFIDIETEAQSTNARITSIGAVCGDLATGQVYTWFQIEIPTSDQLNRRRDLPTMQWWTETRHNTPQLNDVIGVNTEAPVRSTVEALVQLQKWFKGLGEVGKKAEVFSNGPEFDAANLDSLYRDLDGSLPWKYFRNQSVRTMVLLGRKLLGIDPKYNERPGLIEHFALHDALREFEYSSEIYQCLAAHCKPLVVETASGPTTNAEEVVDEGNSSS